MIILILRSARQFGFNNGRQKKDTIYRNELCYGFLGEISKNQNRNFVPCAKLCKVCSGFHLTLLHGFNIEKHKKSRNNEDTYTKKNKLEGVKYISINTRSDAICARFCNGSNQRVQLKQFKPIHF